MRPSSCCSLSLLLGLSLWMVGCPSTGDDDDSSVTDDDDSSVTDDDDSSVADDDDSSVADDDDSSPSCADPSFSLGYLDLDGLSTIESADLDVPALTFEDDGFTLEFWINPTTVGTEQRVLNRGTGFPDAYWVVDVGANANLQLEIRNNDQVSGTTNSLPDVITAGVWQHAAIVLDRGPGEVRFYVDGQPAGATTLAPDFLDVPSAATGPFLVPGAFQPMAGALDEIRAWDLPRTALQIQANRCDSLTTGAGLTLSIPFEADLNDHGPSAVAMVASGAAARLEH